MLLKVSPSRSLKGEVTVPGDKSITHRAMLFASMAKGESCIRNPLVSGVTRTMLDAVQFLGVSSSLEGNCLWINSPGLENFTPPPQPLNCKNSATTMRLLAGVIAAAGIPAVLDGSEGLRRRPMGRVIEPLQQMGVLIHASESGGAPVEIMGRSTERNLKGLRFESPVASAQVKSCVLLGGLAANSPVVYLEPALSRDHTERMLSAQGVDIETTWEANRPVITMQPGGRSHLRPLDVTIPGDFSAAAFLMTAALITPNSEVVLQGVGLNATRAGLMATLQEMGGEIEVIRQWDEAGEPVGDLRVAYSKLRGGKVGGRRVVEMIDEFPIFGIAAAFAEGTTEVAEAAELRLKESDRIRMICDELSKQGVRVIEKTDGFTVFGSTHIPGGGIAESHGDHRLAMSLAALGLNTQQPVFVRGAEIAAESYPEFFQILQALGAEITTLPDEDIGS
ncbi:MAG: 3-phosphoshikimate 1-carboxyvinyltransferase [Anaerolineaceae bacterium]|nr:3-phosphoshikimate 1-carboxyvinyltransferase [Anaerolineaceae bacterium]